MQKQLSVLAVIVIAMSFSTISYAQLEKGKFLIGGDINYYKKLNPSYESRNNSGYFHNHRTNWRNFSTSLNFGYLLSERFELGIYFGYGDYLSSSKNEGNSYVDKSKSLSKNLGTGPYIRYYVPVIDKFYFFGEFQSGINIIKNESTASNYNFETGSYSSSENSSNANSISTSIRPGICYFPLNWLFIEAKLGGVNWNQITGEAASAELGFNLGFNNLLIGTKLFF
jgi:hypothetical protein